MSEAELSRLFDQIAERTGSLLSSTDKEPAPSAPGLLGALLSRVAVSASAAGHEDP
jgi:hypothetical protein